ncbi:MAG: hypothetical protein V2B18_18250, partial [Pseudomonadota bacterium]
MMFRRVKGTLIVVSLTVLAAAALPAWGIYRDRPVLDIGNGRHLIPVSKGEIFRHSYVQSMYDVPVTEKFQIEDGYFRLIQVVTESDAVLVYLGLERGKEPNDAGRFVEFTIPLGSIGNHVISVPGRDIPLGTGENQTGSTSVKLRKMTWAECFLTFFSGMEHGR